MKHYLGAILVVAALAPLTLDAWADRVQIDSHRKDRDIAIDGDSGDWAGPLVPLGDQHPVSVAAANDDAYLYLVLTASDLATRRQILRQGLIAWFDPEGKDKKHYGIKFPVGAPLDLGRFGRGNRGQSGDRDDPGEPGDRQKPPAPGLEEPVNRLEILGPKKDDAHSFVLDHAPGVSVKIGQAEGSIVYELKVPLAISAGVPYAIGAKPGATIGLGLETPKMERPAMEGGRGGGMGGMGGGMGGRGGGGMGGRGGGMGGRGGGANRGQFEAPKPMKIWATVHLAS